MTHKTSKNVVLAFLSVIMCFALFMGIGLNFNSKQAQAESVDATNYTVEMVQMVTQSTYLANEEELTKGDSLTFTFTVKAINQYAQDTWKYRFAKIVNLDELGTYTNGNTAGTNWYINGAWVNYNNANTRLLPFSADNVCQLTFTPDATGDTYNFVWTIDGTQKATGTIAYSKHFGLMMQGFKIEMLLTEVTAVGESTDYGVYAYNPDDAILVDYPTDTALWYSKVTSCAHEWANVEAKASTCTEKGYNAHLACTVEGCGYKFLYTESEINPDAHDLTVVAGKPATCKEAGYSDYQKCSREGCDYEVAGEVLPIDPDAHTYASGVCTGCGDVFTPTKYTAEMVQMVTQSTYLANEEELTKGDSLTFTFTVKAINQYAQDTWKYRFAKIVNLNELGTYTNGNTTGSNWFVNGVYVNYNNASTRLLPFAAGNVCKLVFTPDATGDNYSFVWTIDGTQKATGTVAYSKYFGLMMQGFKIEMLLTEVTAVGEGTDYGVYAYNPDAEILATYPTDTALWYSKVTSCAHEWANVEAKASTCTEKGYNAHLACTVEGCGYKFLYTESEINPDAHGFEGSCGEGYFVCKYCGETQAAEHNYVKGVCTVCGRQADAVTPVKYTVEFVQLDTQSFYLANATALTKGEDMTIAFTVKAVNKYAQDSWKNRFAKIVNLDELGTYANGNTAGSNWYVDGRWDNYTNSPLLPLFAGTKCELVLTPADDAGDTYNWVWYVDGVQKSATTIAYSQYYGLLLQGWKTELLLTDVIVYNEYTDYGVYAYNPNEAILQDYPVPTENWHSVSTACEHEWTAVEAKAPTCTSIGWVEYEACAKADCEFSTLKYNTIAVDPDAHDLEGTCLDGEATCKLCGATTEVGHEFVDGKCSVCGIFLAELVKEYSVDIKNLTENGNSVYITNATPLKKGDSLTISFYIDSVTKYEQENWKYRFAKIVSVSEIGGYLDGNTYGSNWYANGKWDNYANAPLLPLTEGTQCVLVLTPADATGDIYDWAWYVDGEKLSATNFNYSEYMGILLQGWRFELSLVNVMCYGDATDYGVYAYPVGEDADYNSTMTDNGYFTYYGVDVTVDGENGTFVSEKSYKDGEQGVVTFIPEKGYKIKTLTLNGEDITSEVLTDHGLNIFDYKFTAQQDMNFVVSFEKDEEFKIAYYDYYDISGGSTKFEVTATTTIYRLGTMPATSNVAFIAYLDLGSQFGISSESGRQIGFLQDASNPLWTAYGFEFALRPAGGMVRFKGAPGGNYDRYFDYTMAVGGETILFEAGVYDINETEGMFYFYINGTLIMYEKYDKAGYAMSTGVGGFYTTYQTDVDGGIYVRTTYEFSEIKFAENYEGVSLYKSQYAIAGKEVSVVAEKGYVINGMKVNGVAIDYTANGSVYTFVMEEVPENFVLELEVAYVEKNITITYNAEQVSVTAPEKVAVRDDATVVIKPASGYVIETVKVNGEDVTDKLVAATGGMKLDLINVTEDTTIEVVMVVKTYTITVTADENVTVTAPATVGANESVTFTITTAEGYRVKKMTVNGKVVYPNADGNYVIDSVTEDINFVVVSEAIPVIDDNVPSAGSGCFASISSFGLISTLFAFACGAILLKKKKD